MGSGDQEKDLDLVSFHALVQSLDSLFDFCFKFCSIQPEFFQVPTKHWYCACHMKGMQVTKVRCVLRGKLALSTLSGARLLRTNRSEAGLGAVRQDPPHSSPVHPEARLQTPRDPEGCSCRRRGSWREAGWGQLHCPPHLHCAYCTKAQLMNNSFMFYLDKMASGTMIKRILRKLVRAHPSYTQRRLVRSEHLGFPPTRHRPCSSPTLRVTHPILKPASCLNWAKREVCS